MSTPTHFLTLSDEGVINWSHQLANITLARKRRSPKHWRIAARIWTVIAAGAGLLAAAMMTG